MTGKEYSQKVDELKRYNNIVFSYQKVALASIEELEKNPSVDFYKNPQKAKNVANSFVAEYSMKARQLEQEIKEYKDEKIKSQTYETVAESNKPNKTQESGFLKRVLKNF